MGGVYGSSHDESPSSIFAAPGSVPNGMMDVDAEGQLSDSELDGQTQANDDGQQALVDPESDGRAVADTPASFPDMFEAAPAMSQNRIEPGAMSPSHAGPDRSRFWRKQSAGTSRSSTSLECGREGKQ